MSDTLSRLANNCNQYTTHYYTYLKGNMSEINYIIKSPEGVSLSLIDWTVSIEIPQPTV